jgi:subtilisin
VDRQQGRRSGRRPSRRSVAETNVGVGGGGSFDDGGSGLETTGRYLVLLREDAVEEGAAALGDIGGFRVVRAVEFEGTGGAEEALPDEGAVVFDRLGVAVVDAPPDRFESLGIMAAESTAILAVEPERVVRVPEPPQMLESSGFSGGLYETPFVSPREFIAAPPLMSAGDSAFVDYLRGYRDGVTHLVDGLLGTGGGTLGETMVAPAATWDETELTWGLQATKAAASRFTGAGIRVAVLDTGFDLQHPDFVGRRITTQSFVPGEAVQDGHGHGTHCIGTACGPLQPGQLPRYGIAYEAEIFAGKVLSNAGRGADSGILAGIEWAMTNGCAIVSMSLGAELCGVPPQPHSQVFENVGQRALAQGTLIIAAAGNDSDRPQRICPVNHPANCPSIFAVGAVDPRLRIARFSCAGLTPQGGQVDVAGPGVTVRSSWPQPRLYRTIDGTSMATPHVAGIAALFAEANPDVRGRGLLNLLVQNARRLPVPARDVGAGLIQAP